MTAGRVVDPFDAALLRVSCVADGVEHSCLNALSPARERRLMPEQQRWEQEHALCRLAAGLHLPPLADPFDDRWPGPVRMLWLAAP